MAAAHTTGVSGLQYVETVTDDSVADRMRAAAQAFLAQLDNDERSRAALLFEDEKARRWLEYRPEPRPGACLAPLSPAARKAAHLLLATALSPRAYAQAMGIVALEEVLDRIEEHRRGRHSGDYWVSVFGDPSDDEAWSWRFEGHHVSVSMTVQGDAISPTPVFFGANPARVGFGERTVSRPLGPEEDLGRAVLQALGPAERRAAVVADQAPADIYSGWHAKAAQVEPLGVTVSSLGPSAQALVGQLVAWYLDRLVPELAAAQAKRLQGGELYFAWEGADSPGVRHYYRVQGEDLLIEYDSTTPDGNHTHAVLRRPSSDFGDDVLAAHHRLPH